MYTEDREKYNKTVIEWRKKYAKKEEITPNEKVIERLSKEFDEGEIVRTAMTFNRWDEDKLRDTLKSNKK